MDDFKESSLQSMALPSQSRGGVLKLGIITFFAVIITALGTYWLTLDDKEQAQLVKDVQVGIEDAAKDTPLQSIVSDTLDYVTHTPPPASVTQPRTTPGTLAGQNIHADMSPPIKDTTQKNTASAPAQTQEKVSWQSQTIAEKAKSIAEVKEEPMTEKPSTQPLEQEEQKAQEAQKPQDITKPQEHSEDVAPQEKNTTLALHTDSATDTAPTTSAPAVSPTTPTTPKTQSLTPPTAQTAKPVKAITPTIPKVNEDTVIPLPFVDDVATWLVKRYTPRGTNFSVTSLNARYGEKMHTLMPAGNQDTLSVRARVLRYAFNAPMMNALYGLYADRFVKAMNVAAQKEVQAGKKVVPSKILSAYAADFQTLGGLLQAIGSTEDFINRIHDYENAVQNTLAVHTQITKAVHDFNTAKDTGENIGTLRLRVDGLNATYQRSIHQRNMAKENLVGAIRQKLSAPKYVDTESILFVAQWLDRRVTRGMNQDAVQDNARTAGRLLQDLSTRLIRTKHNQDDLTQDTSL